MTATITWFGCAGVEIEASGRRLLVDPYMFPTEPRAHYICISHNDYDHCHEETLQGLTHGPVFERLVLPKACTIKSRLDSPLHGQSTDLSFVDPAKITVLYPKYTREPGIVHPGPTEVELDGFHVETIDSSERPQRYRPDPDVPWPIWNGPFVGDAELPTNGYVITATGSGTTFYHPGDLGEVFDAHRELRDRIDVMFFPVGKLAGLEVTIVDAIRPRRIVPIHYRLKTPEFPIPLHITEAELEYNNLTGAKPRPGTPGDAWGPETHRMMDAHWYPTPDPPLERFESVAPELEALGARITIVQAGVPYQLEAVAA